MTIAERSYKFRNGQKVALPTGIFRFDAAWHVRWSRAGKVEQAIFRDSKFGSDRAAFDAASAHNSQRPKPVSQLNPDPLVRLVERQRSDRQTSHIYLQLSIPQVRVGKGQTALNIYVAAVDECTPERIIAAIDKAVNRRAEVIAEYLRVRNRALPKI